MKTKITSVILIVTILNLGTLVVLLFKPNIPKKYTPEIIKNIDFSGLTNTEELLETEDFLVQLAYAGLSRSSDSIRPEDAQKFTQSFRNGRSFRIPYSWQFDKRDLLQLVATGDSIRFYCGVKLDEHTKNVTNDSILCLIAVAVDNNDSDVLFNPYNRSRTAMYEFAKPCPPKCGAANPILNPTPCSQTYCKDGIITNIQRGDYPY